MQISVTINEQEMQGKFSALRRKLTDLTPVMRDIGEDYAKAVEGNFASQSGPDGTPWAPLSPKTRKRKRGPSILTEKHHLRGSVHYQAAAASVAIGVSGGIPYAAVHQFGGTTQMPGRGQVLHFKMFKSGKRKGRTLFSKPSKADRAMKVMRGAHSITIPARPYLAQNQGKDMALSERDRRMVLKRLEAWMAAE